MGYKITLFLIYWLIRLLTRTDVQGLENLPPSGPYIAATNHLGRLDPVFAFYFYKQRNVILIIAEKYRKYRLARWVARRIHAIFIDRYNADFTVMREVLRRLKNGGVLVVAPEGTRSKSGALLEARPGASYLAAKSGVTIIPIALTGTEDSYVVACLRRLRRPHVVVRLGKPFSLPPLPAGDRDAALLEYTDEIMCRIAALLPPAYRGFYAEHPRLQQLLDES